MTSPQGAQPNYHNYQEVLNFRDESIKHEVKRKKMKFKRTRNGCLLCKKRKKKCDESKPSCNECLKRDLKCEWPEKQYQIVTPSIIEPVIEKNEELNDPLLDNEVIEKMYSFFTDDDFILDQFMDIKSENIVLNESQMSPTNTSSTPSSEEYSIPGIELSEHDLICYNAFVKFLINLITYPHCHPNLSPTAVILPIIAENEIVREVALACGASWLGYSDPTFETEAIERYHNVISLIIKELKDPKVNYSDYMFVCVQLLQGLCMRNMNIGFNATLSAAHFSSSYAIIKKRFLRNTIPMFQNEEKSMISKPLDRILIEKFILFYPLMIMLCHSSKLTETVPSPFSLFAQFYHVLRQPINGFENEDVWTNHPVLGVGLKAHEIATKCCWICRFLKLPILEDDLVKYFSLFVEANNELMRLSKLLKTDLKPSQIENIHVARSMLYASLIILKKLCNYENTTIESLKGTVDKLLLEEKQIREMNSKGVLSIWSLFIGASTSSTLEQKKFFNIMLKATADQLHSSICLKIWKFLNLVWDVEEKEGNKDCVGFEFLFDTSVLDIISI